MSLQIKMLHLFLIFAFTLMSTLLFILLNASPPSNSCWLNSIFTWQLNNRFQISRDLPLQNASFCLSTNWDSTYFQNHAPKWCIQRSDRLWIHQDWLQAKVDSLRNGLMQATGTLLFAFCQSGKINRLCQVIFHETKEAILFLKIRTIQNIT